MPDWPAPQDAVAQRSMCRWPCWVSSGLVEVVKCHMHVFLAARVAIPVSHLQIFSDDQRILVPASYQFWRSFSTLLVLKVATIRELARGKTARELA